MHRRQQPPRPVADLQQPQRMAGRMERHPVRERGADVHHAQLVDQELGQLEHARVRNVVANVRDARRRRRDDDVVRREHALEAGRQRVGLVARVDVHLPAARLLERELDRASQPLEQRNHRTAHPREQGVVEARDEQRHPHQLPSGHTNDHKGARDQPQSLRTADAGHGSPRRDRRPAARLGRGDGHRGRVALRRVADDRAPRPGRARAPGHRPPHARRRGPAVDLGAGGLVRPARRGRHGGQGQPGRGGGGDARRRARRSSSTPAPRRTSWHARSSTSGSA